MYHGAPLNDLTRTAKSLLARSLVCSLLVAGVTAAGVANAQKATILPLPKQPPTLSPLEITAQHVAAGDAEVHVVFAHEDGSGGVIRSLVEVVPGMAPIPSTKIEVTVTGKPILLVLGAQSSVFWDIRVASGVRLVKVIAQGHYQQFLSELPQSTRAIVYREDPAVGVGSLHLSDARAFHDAFHALKRLTGKRPTTVQAVRRGGEITVDGTSTITPPPTDTLIADTDRVGFALLAGGTSLDGLSISNCPRAVTYRTFKANRAFANGKLYAELELKTFGADPSAGDETNVGVMSLAPSPIGRLLAPASHLTGAGIPVLDANTRRNLRNGSVVSLAVDLDAGRLYYGIDGRWLGGAPDGGHGIPLVRGAEYVLAASLRPAETCPGEQWVANFGTKPFRFPLPAGFVAYARGAEPLSAYPLHADLSRITRWTFSSERGWHERFAGLPVAAARGGATTQPPSRQVEAQTPPASPCGDTAGYEVHAVGVYEGEGGRQGPARAPGRVRIEIKYEKTPVCLVLMAYEPVEWLVVRSPGVKLVHVLAMGYYQQSVVGLPDPSMITLWPGPKGSDPRAFYQYRDARGDPAFAERMRRATGKEARTFQNAYRAASFIVDGVASGARADAQRKERTIMCGRTTIVCDPSDTVICGGRRIPCE